MIVFLDANSLMADPMCGGTAWQILAHAPESWSLDLVTSEVAVAESVAGYKRHVAEAVKEVIKAWRRWGRLGASAEVEAFRDTMQKRATAYESYLVESLATGGVRVLPAPDVPHMELVARAVSRRRPCDQKGNGYRDTLVWLTILELSADHPKEEVVLVTEDSDFLDEEQVTFHPDLLEDLDEINARTRVRRSQSLGDVLLELADTKSDDRDLKALRSELKEATVQRYIATLSQTLVNTPLDPRRCALPRATLESFIQDVGEASRLEYSVKGELGEGMGVADFSFEAQTRVVLSLPNGVSPDEYEAVLPMPGGQRLFVLLKPLLYRGVLKLGRFDAPLDGEISEIGARGDDAGQLGWRRGDQDAWGAMRDVLQHISSDPMRDVLKDIDLDPMRDVLRNINSDPTRDVLKDIDLDPMRDALKGFQSNPMRDVLNNIDLDPVRDALRNLKSDPMRDILRSFGRSPWGPPEGSGGEQSEPPVDGPGSVQGVDNVPEQGDDIPDMDKDVTDEGNRDTD